MRKKIYINNKKKLCIINATNERTKCYNMCKEAQTIRGTQSQHQVPLTPDLRTTQSFFKASLKNTTIPCIYVIFAVIALTQQSLGWAAKIQTFPFVSPLVGNIAKSVSLLNSTVSSITLRQNLSIETNSIQRHVIEVNPGSDYSRSLKRVFLSNRTITCNDGSYAGFYLRKNPSSRKWIVFLEGGWHCYDTRSCKTRWLRLRHLMTSAQWPETRDIGGIMSPIPDENPYWHNANHVLVPYCSSDSWSGTSATPESRENNWRFMGALILNQVIADLIPLGLGRVSGAELLLVGSSAGGLGVMLNLDRISHYLLHERNLMVTVRGISDSGWFLDREPYTPATVASSDAVRQGWKLWQGLLPEDCLQQHPSEPWRCYFGYRLYPTLKSPLFVFQWLFDEAQMRADNVGAPVTPQQWNYIHQMGGALRSSLDNVSAVFAPSCIGHAVLSKRDWVNIKIDDISLPSALRCWEHSTRVKPKRHDKLNHSKESTLYANMPKLHKKNQRKLKQRQHNASKENNIEQTAERGRNYKRNRNKYSTNVQREERKLRRYENQRRREERRQHRNRKQNDIDANITANARLSPSTHTQEHEHGHKNQRRSKNIADETAYQAKRQRKENRRRRRKEEKHQREQQQENQRVRNIDKQYQEEQPRTEQQIKHASEPYQHTRVPRVPKKCALRLLERCSWPQCNYSCPTLTNPLTGEEMRFLELLTSFGLDIEAVATALGVDMHTLNNMDRTELVNLLTQQVS